MRSQVASGAGQTLRQSNDGDSIRIVADQIAAKICLNDRLRIAVNTGLNARRAL
jgi:hypothetical protein